jgi:hypothetical protein
LFRHRHRHQQPLELGVLLELEERQALEEQ